MSPVLGMLAFFQDGNVVGSSRDIHWMMIFVMIIAIALAVQAIGFLVAAVFAAKLLARLANMVSDVKERIHPLIDKTNSLVGDLSPKIKSITENVDQISYAARAKVDEVGVTVTNINRTVNEINDTVKDLNGRTRAHVVRVDGMVTEALDTTAHVSHSVQEGIKAPVRHIAGVVTGLKVGLETFLEKQGLKRPKTAPTPYDL
jgi:methyl-accepting chemotaxis protein